MACLAAQPIVNGLEGELSGRAQVLRVDLFSDDGGELFSKYGLRSVPAIVVLDPEGTARYRSSGGMPDAEQIRRVVAEIQGE
jgi:hypothetical protein